MTYGMHPCRICGFECDSHEEAEECRRQHNIDIKFCPKCSDPMDERISANGKGKSYHCKHCKIKYSKEELDNEIKRITKAES